MNSAESAESSAVFLKQSESKPTKSRSDFQSQETLDQATLFWVKKILDLMMLLSWTSKNQFLLVLPPDIWTYSQRQVDFQTQLLWTFQMILLWWSAFHFQTQTENWNITWLQKSLKSNDSVFVLLMYVAFICINLLILFKIHIFSSVLIFWEKTLNW